MAGPLVKSGGTLETLLIDAIAAGSPLVELASGDREALRTRVLAQIVEAALPERTETVRAASLQWSEAWPGVWARVLRQELAEDLQVTLFRMEPYSVVPAHNHGKDEECLVLQGELIIGAHRVGEGDLHIARAGSRHPDITTRTGALLMVRSEIPRVA